MLFLIQYDRHRGRIVKMQTFSSAERESADRERFALELAAHQNGGPSEVVLLEAENEAAIRKTHRRYFETIEELTDLTPAVPRL